jgi:RNA polymerase sigma factor (TIGR02999 family)
MPDTMPDKVARLVAAARQGDEAAHEQLMPLVYDEMRRLAHGFMRRERPGQTLQATGLVHEAWMRLMGSRRLSPQNRAHLLAMAAHAMRQILIERARARRAAKRGQAPERVTLEPGMAAALPPAADVEALDEALSRLAAVSPDQARIVELRFFGGLEIQEIADALQMSPATVKRRWTMAKAWLTDALEKGAPR